jgi:hypothetical protein
MVTLSLKKRARPTLAEWPKCASPETAKKEVLCASPETAKLISMPLTPLGEKVLACWKRISEFWPMVKLLECQVMPDHFHGLLFVEEALPLGKVLGDVIRGFKTGCREVGWEDGYVDNILFREGQLKRMAEYIRDNPRRLFEKREKPMLFRRVVDLRVDLPVSGQTQNKPVSGQTQNKPVSGQTQNKSGVLTSPETAKKEVLCASPETVKNRVLCASPETVKNEVLCASPETAKKEVLCASPETAKYTAHFQAIGNTALLRWPLILPVQCSRRDFAYKRERLATGSWKILRDASGEPIVEYASRSFEEKCEDALACAKKGAVLVSPCISHGEREIARRAFIAGARVIALRNKGFAPFEKPNGALFDQCAKGNLLLLAPAAWPYIPGEKPPTRESSLILNRIAQLLAGDGEGEIKYNGIVLRDIDAKVIEALQPPQKGAS